MKRLKRKLKYFFLSLFVFFVIVQQFSCCAMALDYSNNPPSYLPSTDYIWVELDTKQLGTGVAYFPRIYKDNFGLTTGNQIVNVSSSTMSGYFHSESGTVTQIRISSLDGIDYRYTSSSMSSTYEDLTYSVGETLNTNIPFYDNYTVFNYERTVVTLFLTCFALIIVILAVRMLKGA